MTERTSMRLSVVVVNWNSRDDLRACLGSLHAQTQPDLEIIVVDNGSTDGSAEMVASEFPGCVLLREHANIGFAAACNRGIEIATGPWIATLNNDTVADAGWARALVQAAADVPAHCGMLQSLLLYMDRRHVINSTGIELSSTGGGRDRLGGQSPDPTQEPEEIFCATAGAAAYRRAMLDAVRLSSGYFDRHHFMYFEDADLGWRARLAGWTARYVPASVVHHKWHGSSDRHPRSWAVVVTRTNRLRMLVKNASPWFLVRTSPRTLADVIDLVVRGGPGAWRALVAAVGQSIPQRKEVSALARVGRRAVERRWVVR